MISKFRLIPEALQRQIIMRLISGILTLILFLVVLITTKDIYICVSTFLIASFLVANGCLLYYNSINNKYVIVQGKCIEVETKGLRKRIKAFYIKYEDKVIKVPVNKNIKRLKTGDTVTVYIANNTPIYESGNEFTVSGYYTVEVRKEV